MKALLALSDPASVEAMCEALAGTEIDLEFCLNLGDLRANVGQGKASMVFCQARLPDGTFRDLLKFANSQETAIPVVVCSDFFDKTTYIEAMSLGAYDYIAFPYRRSEVEWIVGNVFRKVRSGRGAREGGRKTRHEIHAQSR